MDTQPLQIAPQHCNLPIAFSSKFKCDTSSSVQLAYNNTLISYLKSTSTKYHLRQINSKGQIIKQIQLTNIKYFTMTSQYQVIVLSEQSTKHEIKLYLSSWNLKNNKVLKVQIIQHYTKPQNWQYKMFVFKKTKLLCICQYNTYLYKLLYYCLPLQEQDDPIHTCQQSSSRSRSLYHGYNNNNQNNLSFVKLNQNSMIGIMNTTKIGLFGTQSIKYTFKTYYITYNCKGKLIEHKFQYKLDQGQIQYIMGGNNLTAYIRDIWQFRPSIFYVEFQTKLYKDPYTHHQNTNQQQVSKQIKQKAQKYYNVYWNYKENIVLKNQLHIKGPHKLQFLQSIRNINEVRNQNNVNNILQQQPLPIYYVNPYTQEIVSYFSGQLQNYKKGDQCVTKFSYPNNYPEYILDYRFNHYTREMAVNVRCYPPHFYGAKMVSTFFLLQINEETDEDLLIEVGYMFGGRDYGAEQEKDQISKRFLQEYTKKSYFRQKEKEQKLQRQKERQMLIQQRHQQMNAQMQRNMNINRNMDMDMEEEEDQY